MNRMGNVMKKTDDAEKKQDMLIMKQIIRKDQQAEEAEKKKKDAQVKLNREINETLAVQVQEKYRLKAQE